MSKQRSSSRSRSTALLIGSAAAALFTSSPVGAQTNPIVPGSVTITLKPVVTIPSADGAPQDLVSANDGSGRLFVATRNGNVRVINPGGTLASTPYLSMSTAGIGLYTGGEGGFPGIAFSPNFAAASNIPGSGKFYTFTTEPFSTTGPQADFSHPELYPSTSVQPNNQIVIREWSASSASATTANTTSRVLMRINHPQSNHQGGSLMFGQDGDLYIGLGDGGGGNDANGSPTSATDGHTNATGNAQDTSVVFGKILRIDPAGNNSANGQYGIPAGNPFTGSATALHEIYAYGFRNPYRISFDNRAGGSGSLFVGDVGQNQREEVDIVAAGGNYGWGYREGTRDNSSDEGRTTPGGFTSIAPIAEYTHGDGDAIMGGFVYRGSLIPDLTGKYIFGDYEGTALTGRLFYTSITGGTISELKYDTTAGGIVPPSSLLSFGEDANGEIYGLFANGQIVELVPEPGLLSILGVIPLTLARRRTAT